MVVGATNARSEAEFRQVAKHYQGKLVTDGFDIFFYSTDAPDPPPVAEIVSGEGAIARACARADRKARDEASERGEKIADGADNAMKLRERHDGQIHADRLDRLVQERVYPLIDRSDFAAAINALDEIVASEDPPLAQEQTLVAFKGQLFHSMGRADEARRTLEPAHAMSPQGAPAAGIRAAIEQLPK